MTIDTILDVKNTGNQTCKKCKCEQSLNQYRSYLKYLYCFKCTKGSFTLFYRVDGCIANYLFLFRMYFSYDIKTYIINVMETACLIPSKMIGINMAYIDFIMAYISLSLY